MASRVEQILEAAISKEETDLPTPRSRVEVLLTQFMKEYADDLRYYDGEIIDKTNQYDGTVVAGKIGEVTLWQ